MTYKLKHLSKYCCKPANELKFEAVKMAAETGGVKIWEDLKYMNSFDLKFPFLRIDPKDFELIISNSQDGLEKIPVLDFIAKLRMTEEEAEKLEDDRVVSIYNHNWTQPDGGKSFQAIKGHYFKTNEDGTEVTLHKRD